VLVVVGVLGSGMLSSASTSSDLPALSAGELLAAVENAHVDGLSGTVVEKAALGLPQLPNFGGSAADTTSITDLLSGSHTMRVWYAGPSKQRLALIGTVGETDVFHNARGLWVWNSESQTATHTVLPASAIDKVPSSAQTGQSSLTPQRLADQAMASIDATTKVRPAGQRRIADRDAYQLVLTPKASASRVGSVAIAVDAKTKIPLGVQVFARGESTPALDVSFTHIDLSVPGDANFTFTPPKNAKVTEQEFGDAPGAQRATDVAKAAKVVGTGWTSVLELHDGGPLGLPTSATKKGSGVASLAVSLLEPVQGSWGSGHLLDSTLITALITHTGRVYLGAVDPQVLYDAAAADK
jgi:outer membrane lipoprotein-sorting protein